MPQNVLKTQIDKFCEQERGKTVSFSRFPLKYLTRFWASPLYIPLLLLAGRAKLCKYVIAPGLFILLSVVHWLLYGGQTIYHVRAIWQTSNSNKHGENGQDKIFVQKEFISNFVSDPWPRGHIHQCRRRPHTPMQSTVIFARIVEVF
jgi:hypothetical protein